MAWPALQMGKQMLWALLNGSTECSLSSTVHDEPDSISYNLSLCRLCHEASSSCSAILPYDTCSTKSCIQNSCDLLLTMGCGRMQQLLCAFLHKDFYLQQSSWWRVSSKYAPALFTMFVCWREQIASVKLMSHVIRSEALSTEQSIKYWYVDAGAEALFADLGHFNRKAIQVQLPNHGCILNSRPVCPFSLLDAMWLLIMVYGLQPGAAALDPSSAVLEAFYDLLGVLHVPPSNRL